MNRKYFRNPAPQTVRRIAYFGGIAATAMYFPLRRFAPTTRLQPGTAILLTSWLVLGSSCSTAADGNPSTSSDTSGTTTSLVTPTATEPSFTGGSAGTTSLAATTSSNIVSTSANSGVASTTAASSTSSSSTNSDATEFGSSTPDAESTAATTITTGFDANSTSTNSDLSTTTQSATTQSTSASGEESGNADPVAFAQGFHELFIHDECTAPNPGSPDTCLHEQLHEVNFVFGGESGTTYDVELRVRGLFEPTNISGGTIPYPDLPYFKVGGTVNAADYSQWHIEVSEPQATYWLNHYPSTGHTIYQQDFIVDIPVTAGADVSVRVIDGNDRMIDNGAMGLADRQQTIEGVTDGVLDGQVLRIDVESVVAH